MPSVELRARIREQHQAKKEVLVKCVYRGVAYNKKEGWAYSPVQVRGFLLVEPGTPDNSATGGNDQALIGPTLFYA